MMYQCVEKYTERLEALRKERFEAYGCVEYCGIQRVPDDRVRADRDQAAAGLLDIFREFSWSDEFVTAFGVFCNFHVLTDIYDLHDYEQDPDILRNGMGICQRRGASGQSWGQTDTRQWDSCFYQ